jgi:hypothetical protein
MDDEAVDILENYFDLYYYQDKYTNDEFISKTFGDAAAAIMKNSGAAAAAGTAKKSNNWTFVAIAGIVLVVVLYNINRSRKIRNQQDDEQTEQILNQSNDTSGNADTTQASVSETIQDYGDRSN